MTEIDKLVEEIAPLQREDLETWVRESLVITETSGGEPLGFPRSNAPECACSARFAMIWRSTMKPCRSSCR